MSKKEAKKRIGRRELLAKYGPYTAPLVISMLNPNNTYAHTNMIPYSSVNSCLSDSSASGMSHQPNPQFPGHCMVGGIMGGMNAHPIG